MPANVEIPYSKGHLYFSFLIFGIFYYFPINDIYNYGFSKIYFNVVMLCIPTAMLIFFMVRFGIPTIKGEPALELTPTGIVDKVRNRTIYWEDIDSFDTGSTNTSSVVIIYLNDLTRYQPSNYLGYIPYWASNATFGSPVIIGTKFIDVEANVLVAQISEYWDKLPGLKNSQPV